MKRLAVLLLAAAIAPLAHAEKIPRAEKGSVWLVFEPFARKGESVDVKPGDTAWTETVRPADVKRLTDAAPVRIRPGKIDAVPAGAVLFGYQLATGVAYCATIDIARANADAQCFRDLDADGTFDAGYVTEADDAESRYFSSFIKALVPIPKLHYAPANTTDLPGAPMRIVYAGTKDGAPRFTIFVENEKGDSPIECKPVSAGVCSVLGLTLGHAATEGGAKLTFTGAADPRKINLSARGDPMRR